jgi:probable HAF family extracellular repeat protein
MAQAISYNYQMPDDPAAANSSNGTYPFGINDGGTVVGYYYDAGGFAHGFVETGGSYVNLDYPGASQTYPQAINKEGQIVGWYNESSDHGFLYSNGSFTALNGPLGTGNAFARGINDQGYIVGYFQNGTPTGGGLINHGFVYENGIYTTLDDPLASSPPNSSVMENGTVALGINDHDQIVGYYYDSNNHANGFLYSNGKYTTLDDPLGANGTNGTFLTGINDKGQIVGYYYDQLNVQHNFVYSGGTYTPVDGGYALGINNKGQIVGDSFVATPAGGTHSLATSSVQAAPSFGSTVSPNATRTLVNETGATGITTTPVVFSDSGYVTVYTVDLPATGDLTLTGTITTDGNLGIITRADILDWDLTVYSTSLSAGFEFTPLTSTLTSYSAGGGSPYGAIATATTLTLPSTDYVFDLEKAPVRNQDPYGQAVVDGAGSEYFRVETTTGQYDEVQIGLNFPLQLADAGVQLPVPFMSDVVQNSNKGLTTLGGKSEPDSIVTVLDGSKPLGTATADNSGDWSLQTKLSSGTHQFTETAKDMAGNTGNSVAVTDYATSGHQTLTGGSGYDFLIAGPNDTLIAGPGHDTFVFNQGFGNETVANFNPNQDQLWFNALFAQSTAAFVLSQTHDTSFGAEIVVDRHDTVTLTGVTVAQLQAAQTTNWVHFT